MVKKYKGENKALFVHHLMVCLENPKESTIKAAKMSLISSSLTIQSVYKYQFYFCILEKSNQKFKVKNPCFFTIESVSENVELMELSYFAGRNVKWDNQFGKELVVS